jgi:hypothetical protein
MEKIALQSLGHTRADKKEGDDDRCFFGPRVPTRRLPTPPVVDYPPDPSSITDLTRRRLPTRRVLDYQPHPSSITHPTRPRLPTRPVLDYPPDPSSITHSIRPRLPNPPVDDYRPHPSFYPARVFQNSRISFSILFNNKKKTRQFPAHNVLFKSKPSVGRVCRSWPGFNQGINTGIICPDRRAIVNKKSSYTLPGQRALLVLKNS